MSTDAVGQRDSSLVRVPYDGHPTNPLLIKLFFHLLDWMMNISTFNLWHSLKWQTYCHFLQLQLMYHVEQAIGLEKVNWPSWFHPLIAHLNFTIPDDQWSRSPWLEINNFLKVNDCHRSGVIMGVLQRKTIFFLPQRTENWKFFTSCMNK